MMRLAKIAARAVWDSAVFTVADIREVWGLVGEIFDGQHAYDPALAEDLHRPAYPMPDTTPPAPGVVRCCPDCGEPFGAWGEIPCGGRATAHSDAA